MTAAENPIAAGISEALSANAGDDVVKRTLQAVRAHLGMDVAYVSEFVAGRSVFREVDAPGLEAMIKPGDSYSLDDVYCRHILEGRLPQLIPDTANEPLAVAMPITGAVPIGAHVSVPIRLPDGQPYGMFCCLSSKPNSTLNERDLQVMRAFADITAFEINRDLEAARGREEKRLRIAEVIGREKLSIVYQPIFRLDEERVIGFECLARFSAEPNRSPDRWFAEAAEIGLGVDLELAAIHRALAPLPSFPADIYLAVNASPQTVVSADFAAILAGVDPRHIVVEITEHESVADYSDLTTALQPFRSDGVRLAVDDAGAGYSSLRANPISAPAKARRAGSISMLRVRSRSSLM